MFEEEDFMAEFEDESGDDQYYPHDKRNIHRTASAITNKDQQDKDGEHAAAKRFDGPSQLSGKKEEDKELLSKSAENAIEEQPTMGVSWKDL